MKIVSLLFFAALATCAFSAEPPKAEPFGQAPDGTPVVIYTLTNKSVRGLRASDLRSDRRQFSKCRTAAARTPMSCARLQLTLPEYISRTHTTSAPWSAQLRQPHRPGKIHGIDGHDYTLATNVSCRRHSRLTAKRLKGFDKVVWHAEPVVEGEVQGVKFTYTSKDGEEGFPGNLTASVTYRGLTIPQRMAHIQLRSATSDKNTPVNLTQHNLLFPISRAKAAAMCWTMN